MLLKKYLLYIFVVIFLISGKNIFSQDIHFSQFYATPLNLNPSLTGHCKGDWRIMGIHRSQWKSVNIPYLTQSVGFDHQLYLYSQNFSWGINYVHDKSGNLNLEANKFYGSFAYHIKLPEFNVLHIGIQAGYVMKGFSLSGQTYPEQWDILTGAFNTTLPSNEPGAFDEPSYVDLNAGASWSKKFKRFEPTVGAAVYHITQPTESYLPGNNKLPSRIVFHADIPIDITKQVYLDPKILWMTMKGANDFIGGANLGYKLPANLLKLNSFWFGGFLRNGFSNTDAVFFVAGVNYRDFDIGFSYDINLSGLKAATRNKGAFEISLIYTSPSTVTPNKAIPCDRY